MPFLDEVKTALPSEWYYDPQHYERELESIWYQDWVCVARAEEIPNVGDFIVKKVGNQSAMIIRDSNNEIRAFHNTCRHRGSTICTKNSGHFANGRIICPYHTWTYDLSGELVATPYRTDSDDFSMSNYSLYHIPADIWGGFIFLNLNKKTGQSLEGFLGEEGNNLSNWPLDQMTSVHQETKTLKFNWKLFWENYNECYHCPRTHPELCKLVPVYNKGLVSRDELSDEEQGIKRGTGDGVETWTIDGKIQLPIIPGPTAEERERGMVYASFTASMYLVGHPDYVRSVRIFPTGPETTDLVIDWLLMPGTKEKHADKLDHMLELGRLVVEQDGAACELNQQGLRSKAHISGILVAQEYWVWEFHEWVKSRLDGNT
ncbi:MAG: ring-hydroxylating oxygenase subunit alpha [Woeseia sp.]|nr:ring-hydroxylating oxygenase subunit alpha [Woeseia sp.]|tara:strand:- start:1050 stop:2171 length:1122 start_codon:yes stop_codon:yes gene_type:complete